MFSNELENLIQAALEDGILEDYEKAAIVKRAQAEGVDLTELEIYINSLLQRRKRELETQKNAEFAAIEKQKKQDFGKVCPACGRQVPSLALVCECGYEFKNNKSESAVQLLSDKISNIQSRKLKGEPDSHQWKADINQRDQEVLDVITMFPVPNTKEDIMEFLALAAPNSKYKGGIFGTLPKRLMILGGILLIAIIMTAILTNFQGIFVGLVVMYGGAGCIIGAYNIDKETLQWNKKAVVWRAKFDQVLMKGRSLRADSDFTRMLDYYENQVYKK